MKLLLPGGGGGVTYEGCHLKVKERKENDIIH
jgi:hypothetical protein